MIDEDLDKKLRLRQAKMIQQEQTSYSYSRVLNESLRKVLKQFTDSCPKWFILLPKQAHFDDFTFVKSR